MRKNYEKVFKAFFHEKLTQRRWALNFTHDKMSQKLMMTERSYIDLDHGKNGCQALTLALFLIYICENPLAFLEELRNELEDIDKEAA